MSEKLNPFKKSDSYNKEKSWSQNIREELSQQTQISTVQNDSGDDEEVIKSSQPIFISPLKAKRMSLMSSPKPRSILATKVQSQGISIPSSSIADQGSDHLPPCDQMAKNNENDFNSINTPHVSCKNFV